MGEEMNDRIRDFLRSRRDEGPILVVDKSIVRENYLAFAKSLPDTRVFYAVKASTISISPIEAQSKQEPSCVSISRMAGSGLAFTA